MHDAANNKRQRVKSAILRKEFPLDSRLSQCTVMSKQQQIPEQNNLPAISSVVSINQNMQVIRKKKRRTSQSQLTLQTDFNPVMAMPTAPVWNMIAHTSQIMLPHNSRASQLLLFPQRNLLASTSNHTLHHTQAEQSFGGFPASSQTSINIPALNNFINMQTSSQSVSQFYQSKTSQLTPTSANKPKSMNSQHNKSKTTTGSSATTHSGVRKKRRIQTGSKINPNESNLS